MGSTGHQRAWIALAAVMGFVLIFSGCDKRDDSSSDDSGAESTPPSTAHPAKADLVELVRQPVSTEATTVTTPDDRLKLTVEADTFTQADAIVISSINGVGPGFSEAFQPVAIYDISTAGDSQPGKPVRLALSSGERPTRVAWWSEELQGWLSIPAEYDPETGVTCVTIPHFTLFGWFSEAAGYERKKLGHVEVIWDAAALDVPKKVTDVNQLQGKILYSSSGDFAKYLQKGETPKSYEGLPEIVRDVAVYVNFALRQYRDAGFKVPSSPITVIIETTLTSENARDKALGVIHIGEYNNTTSQLKLAAAHELFHAVQNQYLWSLGGMSYLGWWCESTAEYASSIVWGPARPARRPAFKYFSEALTSTAHEHEYESAHFIDFIIGPGKTEERLIRLRKLWVGTLAQHGITDMTDITFPMTMYLKSVRRGGVNEIFRDHVADLFFSETSPIIGLDEGADPKLVPAEMVESWALLKSAEKRHPPLEMDLKGNRRAKVWGVKALPAGDGSDREIELKVDGPLSGYVQATVHVLPQDQRSAKAILPTAVMTDASRAARITLGPKDAAYVVVTNTGRSGQVAMTLNVKDLTVDGGWRLCSADQVKTDAFAPNLRMMSRNARMVNGPGDPFLALVVPADKMDIPNRTTYEFKAEGKAGELSTITAWKETIYNQIGKQDAELKLTITRRWSPAMPKSLRPGSTLEITEQVSMDASPASLYIHSRYKPNVTGLVMTTIDRERLGGNEYTHVESRKWQNNPLEAATTHRWQVPAGQPGDRLRIVLRAADSAPAGLGQSTGAYLDQFQQAQLLYVYEYKE